MFGAPLFSNFFVQSANILYHEKCAKILTVLPLVDYKCKSTYFNLLGNGACGIGAPILLAQGGSVHQ
jgi:hypothetical protein